MDTKLKIWDTNALAPADVFELEKPIYNHDMSPIATRHCLIAGNIPMLPKLCILLTTEFKRGIWSLLTPVLAAAILALR